jgi:16S rRNA processing protein RimM
MSRISVAKIATAHGVRGLVKLIVMAEDPSLLENSPLYDAESGGKPYRLTLKNPVGRYWVAAIDGFSDRTAAEALRHTLLWLDRDKIAAPEAGEYLAADLVGLKAIDESGAAIGTVIAVADFGAAPLLEIKPAGKASFYLPFTVETVPGGPENGCLTVHVPEGLTG